MGCGCNKAKPATRNSSPVVKPKANNKIVTRPKARISRNELNNRANGKRL